jgi:uncharacterized protein (DUF1800 family)
MLNSQKPLQEKVALFWHQVFATGWFKGEHHKGMFQQIDMFRTVGMSSIQTILSQLARNPAMLFWLDNNENHKDEPNENFGRELLELFSMGVGNYTEEDIKNAARAFTGWTFEQPIPLYPNGHYTPNFAYIEKDHDDSEKVFLGEKGRFNGDDIIKIITRQPATANFIARHIYNFFVADEPQVPAWNTVPPQDPEAINTLVTAYFESGGEMRTMLKTLFNSDFFKESRQRRVKSPVELITSTIKLAGTHKFPDPSLKSLAESSAVMGQHLLNPPTVEGWHTGKEWIDGGTLNDRVNFAVNHVAPENSPGMADILNRLSAYNGPIPPKMLVDKIVEYVGGMDIGSETLAGLVRYAESCGPMTFNSNRTLKQRSTHVRRLLQLIVASREYQLA